MLRFWERKIAKEKFYAAKKTWDSKYLVGYLDKVTRLLVLVLSKMIEFVKTFKVKDRNKDENNRLMYRRWYILRKI